MDTNRNVNTSAQLRSVLDRTPHTGMTEVTKQAVVAAATPHLRIGNHDEAIQKGIDQVVWGAPAPTHR